MTSTYSVYWLIIKCGMGALQPVRHHTREQMTGVPLFSGPKGLFAVYCLQSLNTKYRDRCYIGYTPTP